MTRRANSRIAGFTFLFYVKVAFPGLVLMEGATAGEGTAAKLALAAERESCDAR